MVEDLTPQPPSLRGKGELESLGFLNQTKAPKPLSVTGRGLGRGQTPSWIYRIYLRNAILPIPPNRIITRKLR
jgi:hypothetical protein